MKNTYIRNSLRIIYGILLLVVIYSCANIGTPNGGPYDENPPKFVSSKPVPNETNFKGKNIEILFDELIQLDKPSENVIITPPQRELPVIRTAGRKVMVELRDTLRDSTTYTLDFTNSISDTHENNIYENFTFAFSTGSVIDTLEVAGIVLNAENLEPMPGITIGLHSNLEDSAFVKLPFDRTSRTNDKGRFTIRNIKPGTYRIYALNDVNRDYKFDQPGEDIAFIDSLIIPTSELTTRQDTTWKDSLTVDTIRTVEYTRYFPDDVVLRLFKEDFARQYMTRPERPDEKIFTLRFNGRMDTLPAIVPLNFTPADSSWFLAQKMDEGKELTFWLTDSTVWQKDTLQLEVTYPKSDSLNILRPQTDTLELFMRKRPVTKKKKKKDDEPEPTVFLGMQVNAPGSMDMTDTVSVVFTEPVVNLNKDLFKVNQMVDSTWTDVDFDFFQDSTNLLKYYILRPWKYAEQYRLQVDSTAITSIYGRWNDKYSGEFKLKTKEDYGHLYLNIVGVDTTAFVELLNMSDAPIRKAKVKDGGVLFMDLKPDKYYARIVIDTNNNGKWDTGNYESKLQPEEVFYSPKRYEVMQNWDVEETWDVYATPVYQQKALEITKNKPKEVTKKKRNYKDEGQQQTKTQNTTGSTGLPF